MLNSKQNKINDRKTIFKNMYSTINDNNKTLMDQKSNEVKIQNYFKIGVIGCGNIGNFLVKHLIAIKDSSIMNFKIMISTRRPKNIYSDIINSIDENIEIFLDNERVFN